MKLHKNIEKTLKDWGVEYKKGYTAYFTLLLLKQRPMYGYEIISMMSEWTETKVSFQTSAVYQVLKRLARKDFVKSRWQKSEKGPKRKYYEITASGNQLVEIFTNEYILPINSILKALIPHSIPSSTDNDAHPDRKDTEYGNS